MNQQGHNHKQALTIFRFQQREIRTVLINGEPWWVAKDVCDVLEHSDVSMAVGRLDKDEKGTSIVGTPGGPQSLLCVNESGLYHLIFTSRKEEAQQFRRWVTTEVLPTIRKTGSYSLATIQTQLAELNQRLSNLPRGLPPAETDLTDMAATRIRQTLKQVHTFLDDAKNKRRIGDAAAGDLIQMLRTVDNHMETLYTNVQADLEIRQVMVPLFLDIQETLRSLPALPEPESGKLLRSGN